MQAASLGLVLARLAWVPLVSEQVQPVLPELALAQSASVLVIFEQERSALPEPVLA